MGFGRRIARLEQGECIGEIPFSNNCHLAQTQPVQTGFVARRPLGAISIARAPCAATLPPAPACAATLPPAPACGMASHRVAGGQRVARGGQRGHAGSYDETTKLT